MVTKGNIMINIEEFTVKYIKNLTRLLENTNKKIISAIVNALEETTKSDSKIYILGNGGSAATASHMVNDLGAGLKRRKIRDFRFISLADNTSVCTALANDVGYENIFYIQLHDLIKPNDVLIAISCSGNSPNIIKASEYAKNVGAKIIGFTGFDGGRLKDLSDINFHVDTPKGEYGLVEDVHMILNHLIYSFYTTGLGL